MILKATFFDGVVIKESMEKAPYILGEFGSIICLKDIIPDTNGLLNMSKHLQLVSDLLDYNRTAPLISVFLLHSYYILHA